MKSAYVLLENSCTVVLCMPLLKKVMFILIQISLVFVDVNFYFLMYVFLQQNFALPGHPKLKFHSHALDI